MADLQAIIDDLRAEGDELDAIVSDLPRDGWAASTPAEGWTIAHQVAHLSWTDLVADQTSRAAAGDAAGADEFAKMLDIASKDPMGFVDDAADGGAAHSPDEIVREWRLRRASVANSLMQVPAGAKIAWFGPPMSAASLASARLMETWAHGQDIADALGILRLPTDRLRNIAHMGVRTRNFAYMINGMTPPTAEFRVELTSPSGDLWSWGPEDAEQRVSGNAHQFCLLVAQRAHRSDLALECVGADADRWLDIAQVFAGPPGGGRAQKTVEAQAL